MPGRGTPPTLKGRPSGVGRGDNPFPARKDTLGGGETPPSTQKEAKKLLSTCVGERRISSRGVASRAERTSLLQREG